MERYARGSDHSITHYSFHVRLETAKKEEEEEKTPSAVDAAVMFFFRVRQQEANEAHFYLDTCVRRSTDFALDAFAYFGPWQRALCGNGSYIFRAAYQKMEGGRRRF